MGRRTWLGHEKGEGCSKHSSSSASLLCLASRTCLTIRNRVRKPKAVPDTASGLVVRGMDLDLDFEQEVDSS